MSEPLPPERYWLEFANSDRDVLFRYSTTDDDPELDLSAVLSICEFLPDSSPDLVYSMEMGPYDVDVASCFDICCISVVDRSRIRQSRATALIPLTAMLVLSFHAEASPGKLLDFSRLVFHPNPVELCYQIFSEFADGDPVQYYAIVSSAGNIYTTFGNFHGSAHSLCLGWDRLLEVLEDFEDECFLMSEECQFAAAVNFLPFLKLCVFFDENIAPEDALRAAAAFHAKAVTIPPLLFKMFSK
jgi:hypothetical protein